MRGKLRKVCRMSTKQVKLSIGPMGDSKSTEEGKTKASQKQTKERLGRVKENKLSPSSLLGA